MILWPGTNVSKPGTTPSEYRISATSLKLVITLRVRTSGCQTQTLVSGGALDTVRVEHQWTQLSPKIEQTTAGQRHTAGIGHSRGTVPLDSPAERGNNDHGNRRCASCLTDDIARRSAADGSILEHCLVSKATSAWNMHCQALKNMVITSISNSR